MKRTCMPFLVEWLQSQSRLPLILRGARQVGKTWLVRQLASDQQKELIEINFEEQRELLDHFETNDPRLILQSLGSALGKEIDPARCMLFLDEIQAAPILIAKLRWLAEKMPELPVIAAGSLLEFALANFAYSMPVGRIEYMYIEPFSFEEFLYALGKEQLVLYIHDITWQTQIPRVLHDQLMRLFKEYIIVGGLPVAVHTWATEHSLQAVARAKKNLLTTYKEDFRKYTSRLDPSLYEDVLHEVPKSLGRKFVYSNVRQTSNTEPIKQALDLLCRARVCHKVKATSANGLPLAAEVKPRYTKVILLDVGLCSAALDLSLDKLIALNERSLVNKGGIAEQVVGQLLRTTFPYYENPALYYWLNTTRGSSAEVDYIIQHKGTVVPLEVKAGSTGTLKSLHEFMHLKKLSQAVRINADVPHITNVDVKQHEGKQIQYTLKSLPFYCIEHIHRFLDES